MWAATENHIEIVRELLSREDIDINIKDILNIKIIHVIQCQFSNEILKIMNFLWSLNLNI